MINIVLSLLQRNSLIIDSNALDWLFSTTPQAIAALVGLIFAGANMGK